MPSGESKHKWADDDSIAYGDAVQPDSIKRRAMKDNEHATLPTPKAKYTHFSFVFIARLSALDEAIADIPLLSQL